MRSACSSASPDRRSRAVSGACPQDIGIGGATQTLSHLDEYPELAQLRSFSRFGINLQFVEPDSILQDSDEVVSAASKWRFMKSVTHYY
ncbi:hypothetical protein [Brasilonema sp. UFV-L1]|uniref:hypothetical protein n=1 Tax=Brasilonema sp. UFV-L1 TaxID=2234130 RepID=UPI00145DB115|nr:hypothetical protein [Brasilonema sp. UFV-L1]